MQFEILTPEQKLFDGEVTIATFPGTDGSFQIMDHHAPLVSLLKNGTVEYKYTDETHKQVVERLEITGGVVEVLHNKVILLADGLASA